MRKLKKLKKILEILDEYQSEIKNEIEKTKKEHQKIVLESNSKLISEIAKGENLDEIVLVEKYLKKSKSKDIKLELPKDSEVNEELLSHISIEGEDYFYEDKNNGNVYDSKSKKVGQYKCGSIKMFEN